MASATLIERVVAAQRTDHTQVEDSALPRMATVGAVVVALVAVAVTGVVPVSEALLSIALVVGGNVISHRRRRARNRWLKAVIALVVLLVLGRFFTQLGGSMSVDDARLPLASLFLGVQTLHAFDLPRTRDLTFTVSASMALLALAAAAARSGPFLVLLGAWLVLAGVSLWLLRLGENHRRGGTVLRLGDVRPAGTAPSARRPQAATPWGALGPVIALVLGTLVVFLALPRPEVGNTITLPFQQLAQGIPSPGGITNPGLPVRDPGSQDPDDAFDAAAYFGLADTVDIRTAGQLSDQLVLRVRSSRPRLLRGLVFDHYEDNRWTRTAEEPPPMTGMPVRLSEPLGPSIELTQTVEVVASTPNLIFAAATPFELYHAGRSAQVWADDTVSVAATQEAGTIYSVISNVPVASEEQMRGARGQLPAEVAARYLQLPDLTPRTLALSAELIDPAASNYVNAESVMTWMSQNVAYSLDLDDHPPDQDAVDTLLFERRLGWCEPISASMVMLLRAGGVPARWVTGFQPGDLDVLSGYWEVRAKHGHAWVEVWIPQHGWIAFDPTGAVPNADGPAEDGVNVPLLALAEQVLAWLGALPVVGQLGLVTALAALVLLVVRARRRAVVAAPLANLAVTWQPWETPTDLADRLVLEHGVERAPLDVLVRTHHARQLTTVPPPADTVREAHRTVRRELGRH